MALPETPKPFRRVVGIAERCMDARRKQCAHADYFTRDNVAIATVYGGDGLRYCTLTLYGVARRSVLCQLEPRHVDVHELLVRTCTRTRC